MDTNLLDKELLKVIESFPEQDLWTDLRRTRSRASEMREKIIGKLPEIKGVNSFDQLISRETETDVLVRVYSPESQTEVLPALLWIHGGGYCFGSMESDDYVVREMVKSVGCVIVSVDYRLAPEYPFPAGLDDCMVALKWLVSNTDRLSVDPDRLSIGGISAGGGLAAGLALLIRDSTEINLVFQYLLCPMIDDRCVTSSSSMILDKRIWNRHSNLMGWKCYLGENQISEDVSQYAAASRAKNLSGLPSTYIAVGSVDAFVDEDCEYARRLQDSGVKVQLEIFDGGFHGFEYLGRKTKIAKIARDTHYKALTEALFN